MEARRVARWTIIILLGIVAAFILHSFKQTRPKGVIPPAKKSSSQPEMGIEDLELVETVNGVKLWKISANESEFFEDDVRLKGIDIVFFEKEEPILNLSAKEGTLDRKTREINVSSEVVAQTLKDRTRITTTSLTWLADSKILFTTDRFTLTRDDTRIIGKGLVMDPKMERLEIKEEVGIVLR